MTPEEYQQFKNAEKAHLRKLRELKKTLRKLERQKDVRASVENVSRSAEDALDTHQEMMDRLTLETSRLEARLEIAQELAVESAPRNDEQETDRRPTPAEPERNARPSPVEQERDAQNPTAERADPPEKTIGRM